MKDTILAWMGAKYCGWCVDTSDDTWFDRLLRLDQLMKLAERRWYERLYIWWLHIHTDKLKIWMIGCKWHNFHHPDGHPEDYDR